MNGAEEDRPFIRITNAAVYAELQAARSDLRDLMKDFSALAKDYDDTKKRVRMLEWRFFGLAAGLIAAFGAAVMGGLPHVG